MKILVGTLRVDLSGGWPVARRILCDLRAPAVLGKGSPECALRESPTWLPGSGRGPTPFPQPKDTSAPEGFPKVVAPKAGAGSCPFLLAQSGIPAPSLCPQTWDSGIHSGSKYGCPASPGLHSQATGLEPGPSGPTLLSLQPYPLLLAGAARLKTKLEQRGWGGEVPDAWRVFRIGWVELGPGSGLLSSLDFLDLSLPPSTNPFRYLDTHTASGVGTHSRTQKHTDTPTCRAFGATLCLLY